MRSILKRPVQNLICEAPMSLIRDDIDACVFDAYGTLFDFAAAVARHKDALGYKEKRLSDVWRVRQLEYTWLRSLMGESV